MAILKFGQLYQQYGIRTPSKFNKPTLKLIGGFNLPKNSTLHFMSDDNEFGPGESLLLKDTRPTCVYHIAELLELKGSPRILRKPLASAIQIYRKQYPRRKTRLLFEQLAKVKNPDELMVFNYNPLYQWAQYRDNPLHAYYQWYNNTSTFWQNIKKAVVELPERNNFIFFEVPKSIPKRSLLKIISKVGIGSLTRSTHERVSTDDIKNIYVLWEWIGEDRENSLLKDFTNDELMKVNIVFTQDGKMSLLNLGLLDSWRQTTSVDENGDTVNSGIKRPEQLQLSFLMMLHSMQQAEVELDEETDEHTVENSIAPTTATKSTEAKESRLALLRRLARSVHDEKALAELEKTIEATLSKPMDVSDVNNLVSDNSKEADFDIDVLKHPEEKDEEEDTAEFDSLARDLEQYETVSDDVIELSISAPDAVAYEPSVVTPTTAILRMADTLTKTGVISPQMSNVVSKLSESYKTTLAPGSDKTIEEFIKVTEEDVKITPTKIPDIPTVLDKKMLESTLIDNTERYINQVLPKHVLASIIALQNSGCCVVNITKKETRELLNEYDVYSVKIMTLQGKEETKHIRVPHVREDGTLLVGGVNYYLKTLRTDVPIRKVSAARVALTSYYGKLFVERSARVAFNYPRWLKTQLFNKVGVENEGGVNLTAMHGGDVFNGDLKYPRIYGIMAQFVRVVKFTTGKHPALGVLSLDLSYSEQRERNPKEYAVLEKKQLWMIGSTDTGYQILVDDKNVFHAIKETTSLSLGTVEDLFDLPKDKRPIEMATVGVFGKQVPVSVVLAVHLGWDTLIATIKPEFRIVPKGQRTQATEEEYVVYFKDCAYVFKRGNVHHELLFSGFMALSRETIKYDVALFNKPEVYGNILTEVGVPVRSINEIGLMFDMFIDPITLEVLELIKEPTTFYGLLIRAVELLELEQHPYETDLTAQLLKGHERIAGAVYAEVVRSSRIMRSKAITSRTGLELNPDGAWLAVMQDSSKEIINDINPIHNLKQKELVTYSGTGGRSKETMVKRTRAFRESDIGTISEAGVDSSAVGIITYLSANPNLTSTYGTTAITEERDNIPRMLSTSAILAPGSEHDDQHGSFTRVTV